MKRILFCSPYPLSKLLGGPKVILELVEAMEELGWKCDLLGRNDICKETSNSNASIDIYKRSLFEHLQKHAAEYDVVDYDHHCLPYPRTQFANGTLFVARSVLLAHHFECISIPRGRGWKPKLYSLMNGKKERLERRHRTIDAQTTMAQADIVNVSNHSDKEELIRNGIPGEKIVVIPFGISQSRRPLFDTVSNAVPSKPVVAFVGTFDYRKGAREFPAIVQQIVAAVPEVRFRLLGTAGMFQTEAEVLAHFPAVLYQRITVIPRFQPEELPSLLASCSVGIFPSHIEGFGFGVLEMLAAAIPVIAYDAPGPPMMLPAEYLVARGDAKAMSDKIAALLKNETKLRDARCWAKQQSQQFSWKKIAQTTSEIYQEQCKKRQVESSVFTS